MRKVTSFEIIAAAVAAVPGFSFAGEGPGYVQKELTPTSHVVMPTDFGRTLQSGRFMFVPSPVASVGGPEANVDGTWTDLGPSLSWNDPLNWSTNPAIPDGATAIARFGAVSGGAIAALSGATIQAQQLDMNDPQFTGIYDIGSPGNLNLTGGAVLNANGSNFDFPNVIFNFTVGTAGNVIGGTGSFAANMGGSAGLNKTGDTHVQLSGVNNFTGPVSISGGGKLITVAGDGAFGAAANPITLNNGSIQINTANMVTTRVLTMGAGGGSVHNVGGGRTFIVNAGGDIAGSGQFLYNGAFGATAATAGSINVAISHTGVFNIDGGSINLASAGAINNSSSLILNGYLILRPGSSTRIGDTMPIKAVGGQLNFSNTTTPEVAGHLTIDGSTTIVGALAAGSAISFSGLTLNNGGTARLLGPNLGAGGSTITFATAPTLTGGLLPWAYSNASAGAPPESSFNTLVTYGANGVTALPLTPANFETDPSLSTSATNLRVSFEASAGGLAATPGGATPTVNANINANALLINAGDAYFVDDNGGDYTLAGTGKITLTTGVIVSGSSGFDGSSAAPGLPNSQPGNIVQVALDAGANPYYIHPPSAITFNGKMSGTGGLIKAGGRTAFFNSATSDYTGQTILSGFNRWTGNVISGSPSPFGSDTTPIVLYSGNIVPRNPADGAANGTDTAILALDDPQVTPSTFSRPLAIKGPNNSVLIRNFGNSNSATATFNGAMVLDPETTLTFQSFAAGGTGANPPDPINNNSFVMNGVISGDGRVEYSGVGTNLGVDALGDFTISGANTYTQGTDAQGNMRINVDTVGTAEAITSGPFGTGSIQMSGSASFIAVGGPRTIQNALRNYAGNLTLGNQITVAGPVNSVGGDQVIAVNGTDTATISGNIGFGGGYFKQGPGTLVITGNNTFSGIANVGNGTVAGGFVIWDTDTGSGDANSIVGVNADATGGGNSLILRGGRNIADESLFIRGIGNGAFGAVHATTGANTWNGSVFATAQYTNAGSTNVALVSSRMSVGADAGASLTLRQSLFATDPGASDGTTTVFLAPATGVGLEKRGAGDVNVGSNTFISTSISTATSSFNGSVVASGSLTISGGTLRIRDTAQALVPGVKSVFDVNGLTVAAGAKLDITDNAGVVEYDTAPNSPLTTIATLIRTGYNGGLWTGNGITSSLGNANNFAVGFGEASDVLSVTPGTDALFLGDFVDDTAVLIRYVRYGDANLSGQVNSDDFNRLATNFGTNGNLWSEGNFNYDLLGTVNSDDFNLLATNFGLSATGPNGEVTPQDWANLAAAVPEPASFTLLAVAGASLLKRRRRN